MSDNALTITIPSWHVQLLRDEFKKLTKKAKQLNCDPPVLIKQKVEQIVDPNFERQLDEGMLTREQAPKINIHTFTIEGKGPKLADWKFLGTLDHNTIPGSVIVNAVPGETVPQQFFHNDAVCNHCGKIRRRTETFVVEHENGEQKQVGRQCIRDFLGHDPAALLRYLTNLQRFVASLDDEEKWGYGGGCHDHWTFNQFEVLKLTNAVIRSFGWISRSKARQDVYGTTEATADTVLFLIAPSMDRDVEKERQKLLKQVQWDDEKDEADANGALQWLETQTDDSEYLHNLRTLADANAGVPATMFGYWCSLMATYQREQQKLIRAQRTTSVSEWYGNVKDKIELVVKLEELQYLESRYGTTQLHKMIDTDGRAIVWFASSNSGMAQGHSYRIKGTVKKHDEFNNWKQTILTRVKALEEIE